MPTRDAIDTVTKVRRCNNQKDYRADESDRLAIRIGHTLVLIQPNVALAGAGKQRCVNRSLHVSPMSGVGQQPDVSCRPISGAFNTVPSGYSDRRVCL